MNFLSRPRLFCAWRQGERIEGEIKQVHIDITEVEGGARVYGAHSWLEWTLTGVR